MYLFFKIFLITVILCFLFAYCRRFCVIKKVCSMTRVEKYNLLNELARPLGYEYLPCQDIFLSTYDAWQRNFGYRRSFDCAAAYLNMVFDSEPVYFDYDGRTWLVELWKGQYGINTGAEIGIYRADGIVPPQHRSREHFHVASDGEIPVFSMHLAKYEPPFGKELANISMPHWWLAAFRMGCFSSPEKLWMEVCINFPDRGMMLAFADALIKLGYDECSLQQDCSCICFSYQTPQTPPPCGLLTRIVRCVALCKNRFFCWLYRTVTRPFCSTFDRLLYLYFFLPLTFRCCMRLRRCKRMPGTNKGQQCSCSRGSCRFKKRTGGGNP